jgi:serine/threonine protein kinase
MNDDVGAQCQIEQVTYWQPKGVRKSLAVSSQNYVGLMEDDRTVLKYPHRKTQETLQSLRAEADRYARLGTHENLVTYKGSNEDGLLLEYCERGALLDVIEGPIKLTDDQKMTIGTQVARCVVYLHKHNFIHCDLHVRNVFLTSEMVAKVGDLQGQLFRHDGSIEMETMSQENAKSRHPCAGDDEFSWRTDIFALGTLLYHLWHGHPPFPELDEHGDQDLIQAKYQMRQYPIDVTHATGIDAIIGKCWASKYRHISDVLDDMDNLSGLEV